jgi:hydroxymethylpyrimidine pyrophosphatase-like HAD family hydrolase
MKGRIFFDVDGTLVDKDDVPRHGLKELFQKLSKTHHIVVWSGGGKDYAEMKVHRIGLSEYVSFFAMKTEIHKFRINKHDICIDDQDSVVNVFNDMEAKGYKVPFYESNIKDERSAEILSVNGAVGRLLLQEQNHPPELSADNKDGES